MPTQEEIQAANLQLDFTEVEEAEGSNMTVPGTIAKFKITEGEFVSSKEKGTPGLRFTFTEQEGSSFGHSFWLTAKALGRIKHLVKHAAKAELSGTLTPAQIIAMVKGKIVPLKVTAQINHEQGRVYPDLPFGGFAADTVEELSFTAKEKEVIENGKNVQAKTNISNADTDATGTEDDLVVGSAEGASQTEADDFQ